MLAAKPLTRFSQLQYDNRTSLINTNQTLETLQAYSNCNTTMIERIEVQTSAITTLTETSDQTLGNVLSGIERINNSLDTISPAIQNLQHIGTTELSALEAMFELAVMRALKIHAQETENNLRMDSNDTKNTAPMPRLRDTPSEAEDLNNRLYSESYAMIRRDKTVFKSSLRTPFFDIEIETREAQKCLRSKAVQPLHGSLSKFEPTQSQRVTKYQVRVKIPFWRGGMTFHCGNANIMYGGGFYKSFRTYNFVPKDAPIIKACKRYDLQEVQRLFKAGLASPFDRNYEENESLVDIVLTSLFWDRWEVPNMKTVELLQYLIACLGGDAGLIHVIWKVLYTICEETAYPEEIPIWEEAFRLAIEHSSEDPFTKCDQYLSSLKLTKTALYPVLTGQQKWWLDNGINMDENFDGDYSDLWCETDLQMLADPEALNLQAALENGLQYIPYHKGCWEDFLSNVPLHLLLRIASETLDDQHFQQCVIARLVVMLRSGSDPRRVYLLENPYMDYRIPTRRLYCTGYAQCLGLATLWRKSLEGAGWSSAEIEDLFDEELYLGIPELIDGRLKYQTRDVNRKEFIETLRRGGFMDLDDYVNEILPRELESQVGLSAHNIRKMITEVTSVVKRRATPGSWIDNEAIELMPGRDFTLPWASLNFHNVQDWKCIREIWKEELDGCIPEGYDIPSESSMTVNISSTAKYSRMLKPSMNLKWNTTKNTEGEIGREEMR